MTARSVEAGSGAGAARLGLDTVAAGVGAGGVDDNAALGAYIPCWPGRPEVRGPSRPSEAIEGKDHNLKRAMPVSVLLKLILAGHEAQNAACRAKCRHGRGVQILTSAPTSNCLCAAWPLDSHARLSSTIFQAPSKPNGRH